MIKADFLTYQINNPMVVSSNYDQNRDLFSFMRNLHYLELYANKLLMPYVCSLGLSVS